METNDILKSLSNLEQNLKNIDSARQQVLNTVNAYDGAREQLQHLVREMTSVREELSGVFQAINENQVALNREFSEKTDEILARVNGKLSELDGTATAILTSFEGTCKKSGTSLTQVTQDSLSQVNSVIQASIESQMERLAKLTADFHSTSDDLNKIPSNVHQQMEVVQRSIAGVESDLGELKKQVEALEKSVTQEIKQGVESHHNGIMAVLQKMQDGLTEIRAQQQGMDKKLVIGLVGLAISVILNIILLIR